MQKEKGRTANSTTSISQTRSDVTTKAAKIPTLLERAILHLLENAMNGTSQLTAFAAHHDFNYRNSIDELRNDHEVIILDEFFDHQHSGDGIARLKRYWLPDREQARKVIDLVNLKRHQRGAAPLSREQIDRYLAAFPVDPGFLPAA